MISLPVGLLLFINATAAAAAVFINRYILNDLARYSNLAELSSLNRNHSDDTGSSSESSGSGGGGGGGGGSSSSSPEQVLSRDYPIKPFPAALDEVDRYAAYCTLVH
eukprot:COSAG06_NODE_7749_length_2390_cov_47.239197_3_plen_107_part_00